MDRFDTDTPAFDPLEQRLRSERPELTAFQLDAVKGHVRRRVRARSNPTLGRSFMKSRLALTLVLVLGLMMTGTGATIAITGASDSGNAGVAQYNSPNVNGNEGGNLAGEEQGGGGGGGGGEGTQPAEQVAAQGGSGSLPFTGFVAIPLLVGGAALAGTGAVLRRRTREE
jgi:hypothetical protein